MAADGYRSFETYGRSWQYHLMRIGDGGSSDDDIDIDERASVRSGTGTEQSQRSSDEQDVALVDSDHESINRRQSPLLSEDEHCEGELRMVTDSSNNSDSDQSDAEFDEDLGSGVTTDDEDNEREANGIGDRAELLYDGSPLTTAESCIAILNVSQRHKFNGQQLKDILGLIALHCPDGHRCKKSLYSFKKYFNDINMPLIRHYYCTYCYSRVQAMGAVCEMCETEAPTNSYFLESDLIPQIEVLYKRPGFHELLGYRFTRQRENEENYEDIYDASVYKNLCSRGGFLHNRDNISFTCYTDGIRIYRSSKYSIWVVFFVINKLPFDQRFRKENVLLAAVWFGDSKPCMNVFLEPLTTSIRAMKRGINVRVPHIENLLTVRGLVIFITSDLQAKPLLQNMTQYNGRFGCQICKQLGLYLREHKVRVYPYEAIELRTDDETCIHVQQAERDGISVCGVKGASILSRLVYQRIRATAVDVMHCVFEGVVKSLMELWFSQKNSDKRWSLREHIDIIDQRLMSLTPPSSNQRLPRSIKDHLPYWKAHESKSWFLYFSIPCLNQIMDDDYFDHYKLAVLGISILCQSSISPDSLNIASRALEEFVARFEYFYDLRSMSNNVHQLRHLAENVRRFGPLWTTSCFPFEDLNGTLKRLVHGSNAAHLQILSAVSMYLNLTSLKSEESEEERRATTFCENLDSRRGRIKRYEISDSVYIVGKCTEYLHLPVDIGQILDRAGIRGTKYSGFLRLLKKKVMYSSTEYRRSKRTNSTYANYTSENGSNQIGLIRCFVRVGDCVCRRLCNCASRHYAITLTFEIMEILKCCEDKRTL